jgi:hypothetical protein
MNGSRFTALAVAALVAGLMAPAVTQAVATAAGKRSTTAGNFVVEALITSVGLPKLDGGDQTLAFDVEFYVE